MRLLAESYNPTDLNRVAFALYADFRPRVDGWGKKGELRCKEILAARRNGNNDATRKDSEHSEGASGASETRLDGQRRVIQHDTHSTEPDAKRVKLGMSVEEYEAQLDEEGYEGLFSDPEG